MKDLKNCILMIIDDLTAQGYKEVQFYQVSRFGHMTSLLFFTRKRFFLFRTVFLCIDVDHNFNESISFATKDKRVVRIVNAVGERFKITFKQEDLPMSNW